MGIMPWHLAAGPGKGPPRDLTSISLSWLESCTDVVGVVLSVHVLTVDYGHDILVHELQVA